jgi:hypothetical protein
MDLKSWYIEYEDRIYRYIGREHLIRPMVCFADRLPELYLKLTHWLAGLHDQPTEKLDWRQRPSGVHGEVVWRG